MDSNDFHSSFLSDWVNFISPLAHVLLSSSELVTSSSCTHKSILTVLSIALFFDEVNQILIEFFSFVVTVILI